ncbi:hypothetical protein ACSQ6I_07240 [Anabaena sp. WFMT]|uniref:hypothetical protein n=1 Tax=Anabaena sp. WFMT TaxID=3449730 RepID=UPI003F29BB5C
MSKFSLAPYTLKIKQKDSSQYYSFSKIIGSDFFDIIYNYLDIELRNPSINSGATEIFKINKLQKSERIISGLFETGENGFGSKLVNVPTGKISYQKSPQEAELIPYYFILKLPPLAKVGIIIFQRFKNLGIKDLFFRYLSQYLLDKFSNKYILEMNPLIPTDLLKKYIEGRIVQVRFIKRGFPSDKFVANIDGFPDDKEHNFTGRSELVLAAPRKGNFPAWFCSQLNTNIDKIVKDSHTPLSSLIELSGFDYENVKIKVQVGKNYKTIDLSHTDKLRYYEDISKIKVDPSGHPEFDSINFEAQILLEELALCVWGDRADV